MKVNTDIDIDVADRSHALSDIISIPAMVINKDGARLRHPVGVYFQDIPIDPIHGFSSIPYEKASDLGYFKIDLLNNSIYESVKSEEHLNELIAREPMWDLFMEEEIVKLLPQLGNSFYVVEKIEPTCVEDLAVIIALIRPAKRHLINRPRHEIDAKVWLSDDDTYAFKRAHAIAYAVSIIVKLNLICEEHGL